MFNASRWSQYTNPAGGAQVTRIDLERIKTVGKRDTLEPLGTYKSFSDANQAIHGELAPNSGKLRAVWTIHWINETTFKTRLDVHPRMRFGLDFKVWLFWALKANLTTVGMFTTDEHIRHASANRGMSPEELINHALRWLESHNLK